MSFRQPVRPLDKNSSEPKMPRELVVDYTNGDLSVYNDTGVEVALNELTLETSGSGQAIGSLSVQGRKIIATKNVTIPEVPSYTLSISGTTLTLNPNLEGLQSSSIEIPATEYGLATSNVNGLIKIGYATSGKNYAVQLDGNGRAYVNVPWTDNNTTYGLATSNANGLIKIGYTESGKYYAVQLDGNGKAFVYVPWTDNNTTYGLATSTTNGLIKIGYNTSGKNYAVQLDSSGKAYVNVPWTDTDTTYGTGTASTAGIVKLYTSTGTATDGSMTQSAINTALGTKLNRSGGTMTGTLTTRAVTVQSGYTLTITTAGNVSGIAVQYTATIGTSWSGSSAPYRQTITVSGIKSTDVPIVDYTPSGTYSTDSTREEQFMSCIHRIVANNNSITVYAHEKTTTSIPIRLRCIR